MASENRSRDVHAWVISKDDGRISRIIMALYFLVIMISVLSVSVKRLHDMGRWLYRA
jgi:uncharacterized membrane protein YhaH (DUF805 family)